MLYSKCTISRKSTAYPQQVELYSPQNRQRTKKNPQHLDIRLFAKQRSHNFTRNDIITDEKQTDRQTDRQTDGRTNRQTFKQIRCTACCPASSQQIEVLAEFGLFFSTDQSLQSTADLAENNYSFTHWSLTVRRLRELCLCGKFTD